MRKLIYIKGKIWESAKLRVMPNIEWTDRFWSQIWFSKFRKLEIPRISNLENSKYFQLGKFRKLSISKSRKIVKLEYSKHVRFVKFVKFAILKFQKFPTWKIPKKLPISKIPKISKNLQLRKLSKFHKLSNVWIILYFECSNNWNKYKKN